MHIFLIIILFVFLACIWESPFDKIQKQLDELQKTPEQRELERICEENTCRAKRERNLIMKLLHRLLDWLTKLVLPKDSSK